MYSFLNALWVGVYLSHIKDSQSLSWTEVPTLKNLSRIQVAESSLLPTEAPNHHLTMGNWVVNHWFSVLFLVSDVSLSNNYS